MKKILTAIVLFVFVALPMSVMAMTTIADNDLSTVTGQSGVSISADITMNVNADTLAWGDADGVGGGTTAGWVGLKDFGISNLRMHMRSDNGMVDYSVAFAEYQAFGGVADANLGAFIADISGTPPSLLAQKALLASILATQQFLTIDVYTTGGVTAVRIGLPTFEIDMASLDAKVGLWTDNAGVPGTFQEMGRISVKNMVALVGKGNFVDISKNNTASGVLINVGNTSGGNTIDKLTIASMSWGDADGLAIVGAPASSGYIGLTNFVMNALKVVATLNINVCTPTGFAIPTFLALDQTGLLAYEAALPTLLSSNDATTKDTIASILHSVGTIGTTSVDIALTANINIASMYANVKLGPDSALATGTLNTLGQFYVGNLTVAIPAYNAGVNAASWVAISAH
jgi:hypothetical protein